MTGTSGSTITSREQLVCVLRSAAELEHLLSCQYLFAGFSLRKNLSDFPPGGSDDAKRLVITRNQRWGFKVMQIARQEMEHLGIVTNLLGALGEQPWFDRPNFPVPGSYLPIGAPFVLQRFGRQALERFLAYERPDFLHVPPEWSSGGPQAGCIPSRECGVSFADVQQLYDEIATAFQTLPPGELFVGDSRRQVDNTDTPSFGLGVTVMPVTDRDSAQQAIDLILEQGEGIGDFPLTVEQSHFSSFNQVLQDLLATDGGLDPALPVVDNPALELHSDCSGVTLITDPEARQAMELFNRSYGVMLAYLGRFFETFRDYWGPASAVTGLDPLSELRTRTRNAALLEQAFFPFMTMVIRPLGDYIARLPAFADDGDGPRAGPSYELAGGHVPEIEDYPGALGALADEARALVDATGDPARRAQLQFLADNVSRMHQNFRRVWFAVSE